jgi:hypothetical protein
MLPDVVVKVTVWPVIVGAFPWGVLQPLKQRATPAMANRTSMERRRLLANGRSRRAPSGKTAAITIEVCGWLTAATAGEAAATETVAVAMVGEEPEIAAGLVTLQVMDATGLEQVTLTDPVKPETGVIARVVVALAPAAIRREEGVAATVKVPPVVTGGVTTLPPTFTVTLPKENEE